MSDDKPPLFGSWRKWYIVVLAALVIQMVVYYWLTRSFS
jgi:hypothetical protein